MVKISAMMGKMWSETNEKARAPFVTAMEKSKAKYEKKWKLINKQLNMKNFKEKKLHNLIAKYVEKIPNANKSVYKVPP
eukprot:UN09873